MLFGISLKLGLNGISLPLFVLAGIVGCAAGIYALISKAEGMYLYFMLLLVMQSGLMGTFASVDIFFFYFFHELALIPTFIMIGIWGGNNSRFAAMELTIYLTLGSMLSLIGLIALYVSSDLNSFDLISLKNYLDDNPITDVLQQNIFVLFMLGFGILVSLWPFHSWAPKGYAAAPTSAAMLHAGVLKKFGLYGLVQVALPLLPVGGNHWFGLMALLALGNIIVIGFVAMAQRDLNQMIGYSSVMHIGYCFLGVACFTAMGVGAAVVLMFAHGLSVALLFLLSTMIQNRTHTLELKEMGGLVQKSPVLCGFFVAAMMAHMGLPGFANFWGELSVFISVWECNPWLVYPAVAGIVISSIYGLRAVANIFFAEPTKNFKSRFDSGQIVDMTLKERIPSMILVLALVAVGVWPELITKPIDEELKSANFPKTEVVALDQKP